MSQQPGSLLQFLRPPSPALQFRVSLPGQAQLLSGQEQFPPSYLAISLSFQRRKTYKQQTNQADTIAQRGNATALLLPHVTAHACRHHEEGFILFSFHYANTGHKSGKAAPAPPASGRHRCASTSAPFRAPLLGESTTLLILHHLGEGLDTEEG